MDTQKTVDTQPKIGYNSISDDNMIVVKMDEQVPIHDTSCRHPKLIADPDDTLGDAIYHGCANQKCGVGFYIKK